MTSVFNVFDYVMENDVNLLKICVDMADQEPIDPSKMIGGRRAMTQSHRRERQRGHIPKRGRGRRADGSGTSQPSEASQAQPEESQVVDPTQAVEYLNYQDHHDVTDGGYDEMRSIP